MTAHVEDETGADRLAVLRGAATARNDTDAMLTGNLQGRLDVGLRLRERHPLRHDLVDRGIAGITPARKSIERHLAFEAVAQTALQGGIGLCAVGEFESDHAGPGSRYRCRTRAI